MLTIFRSPRSHSHSRTSRSTVAEAGPTVLRDLPRPHAVRVPPHPLIEQLSRIVRAERTPAPLLRAAAAQLVFLLGYEALREAALFSEASDHSQPVVFLGVRCAGLGLMTQISAHMPDVIIGHVTLPGAENEQDRARLQLRDAPPLSEALVVVCDPVITTGGASLHALRLAERCGAQDLRLVSLAISEDASRRITSHCPHVSQWSGSLEPSLAVARGRAHPLSTLLQRLDC